MHNYWQKRFDVAQGPLERTLDKIKIENEFKPAWWRARRTVLVLKTKDLSGGKNYSSIMCLNTSYKIMAGLVGVIT